MIASLEGHEHDLEQLVKIARAGEEVVLTENGHAIAKITALPVAAPVMTNLPISEALQPGWPQKQSAIGTREDLQGMTPDEVVAKLRSQKNAPTEAEMESRRRWLDRVARHAAAAATGKEGCSTSEEIIDDIRSERC